MKHKFSRFIDFVSNYLAHRKGLLPTLGLFLITANWIIQLIPGIGWLAGTNSLLHLGLVFAIVGFMVAWAL
jgi:hypothetical protein